MFADPDLDRSVTACRALNDHALSQNPVQFKKTSLANGCFERVPGV